MWLPLIGLLAGILIGSVFSFTIPIQYAKYMGVATLAALDSVFGSLRAYFEDRFDGVILLSGFFVNALLAALLAFLGDRLGVDLFLAAVVAFGVRLFQNLAVIRRYLFDRITRPRQ